MSNNLHRNLAPITDAAWNEIEEETRRTFTRWIAGRRVVDVEGPEGVGLAAVGTGHLRELDSPEPGVEARQRVAQLVVELRVPFRVSRAAVDDVERGSKDSDWQPVKDAVERLALAEDRAIFHGNEAAGIDGIVPTSSNEPVALPEDVREFPDAVAKAASALRLAGVDGPYALCLSAELYTAVSETTDHGYPIREHLEHVVGDIVWAPGLDGALLLSTRGGDYALHLGQDLSIGYLSHDADSIELYHQETLTFLVYTSEASVAIR
ncbi:family 1 encapsulin nanocompartment shell protein [Nigerium sp.]|uniref:family 1 encapsulin nanocompartment shell protein n=1 Tax=Nigerium sp. TaxID=2042655 RepID=UPI003221D4CA